MKIFDSHLKEKTTLTPMKEKKITMYICGPTVYDDAHLGHARSSISFDLLTRFLITQGFEVILAKNFTDIDDKLINKALQTGVSVETLASKHIESYLKEMSELNVLRPTIEPRAMHYLSRIVTFIESLLDKGVAYELPSGDVYLEVAKDAKYGTLSHHLNAEDSINRVENAEGKKDARDFALWKAYKGSSDIGYEVANSRLRKGRPGWHIECSAMIDSALAYKDGEFQIDIHAGGADLFFPHHENEASQTRCLHNKEIAKYWLHNGFVNINGEKMSKSLGNSFFIKDALKSYHGEILRNYLLGFHYRAALNFNEEDLLASKKRLDKIYRLKKRLDFTANSHLDSKNLLDSKAWHSHLERILRECDTAFSAKFFESLSDDLNISLALSVVEEFLKEANELLDSNPKDKALKARLKATLELIDFTLGLGALSFVEYFQLGVSDEMKKDIESKINARLEAKKNKDFALADSIRDELLAQGIAIMDKPGNITEWEKM
ncbi:cysteine--tRNA ligase [Helicobacter saguini]|uniref:Cysteine--tRNA ligase n=1 Tax=Helicobacter saguini TaxID=1548018 RepID=A0A347VMV5_9HELI|nr:cysteine--tRNA ligase [Helicobacter saguini]MWV62009.1 cysteine--tRNA ligase [Helicobacter saguini]MWV67316.1 cysteine--tRNA ligase [Helicobacter saguini]MWV69669.1 cysteine--tRNA ligase [Helicobacter saguini]MWV73114.1 cysteine--tRNA ligase [Helicobacter saguini]TLD95520.1 cysteine--tRNA ligase [Helicobacter saguini]